nr:uncharacterized protein CTRU02_10304 [Colletotrichum truncatum]KAF6787508.1 hypothetical protein CTRU02_10304 [Colletotrichum truncatum]
MPSKKSTRPSRANAPAASHDIRQWFKPISAESVEEIPPSLASPPAAPTPARNRDSSQPATPRQTPQPLASSLAQDGAPPPAPLSQTPNKRKRAVIVDSDDEYQEYTALERSPSQPSDHHVNDSQVLDDTQKGPRERRFEALLPTLVVRTRYRAPKSLAPDEPFNFIYNLPAIPGQDYTPEVVKHQSGKFADMVSWELRARKVGESHAKMILRVSTKDFTKQEALALCEKLVHAKKVWRDPTQLESPKVGATPALINSLCKAAVLSLFPHKPFRIAKPALTLTEGTWYWLVVLPFVDVVTHKLQSFKWRIPVKKLDSSIKPIPATENVVFTVNHDLALYKSIGDIQSAPEATIPNADTALATSASRTYQFTCHAVSTWLRNRSLLQSYVDTQQFKTEIFELYSPSNCTTRAKRLILGENGTTQLFRLRACIFDVRIIPGDRVLMDLPGLPSLRINSRNMGWAEPIGDAAINTWLNTSDILAVWQAMARDVDNANDQIFRDQEAPNSIRMAIGRVQEVEHRFINQSGTAYINAYSGMLVRPPVCRSHPLNLSIDAIFPLALDATGAPGSHVSGNIEVIPFALNMCKHTHLPIFLQELGKYYRQWIASVPFYQSGVPTVRNAVAMLQEKLVHDCRRFTDLKLKVPWSKASRLRFELSPEQMRYLRDEWVSGKPHPGDDTVGDVKAIVKEIEDWTGVDLIKSEDGCAYFAHVDTLPRDWSWETCGRLMTERYWRMRNGCNKKHNTVDTSTTLYLECVYQACVNIMVVQNSDPDRRAKAEAQAQYGEFLGLPLAVEYHNPLNFAHLYPDIKEMVAEINIPLEYANENLELGPFDARLSLGNVVDNGEDEDKEGIEDDMDWMASDGDEDEMED